MRHTHRAAVFALLCTASSCSHPPESSGSRIEAWEIVPIRTIGGPEEGPSSFSDVRGLVIDAQHRILVLEHATQQIEMFDSLGQHLRTIGRKGHGPGEMTDANGLLRAPDGTLWVNDPANNRFTVFGAEGEVLKPVHVNIRSYGYTWQGWFEPDGSLIEPIHVYRDTTSVERLQRFRERGTKVDTLAMPCDGLVPVPAAKDNFLFEFKGGSTVTGIPFKAERVREFDRQAHAWCGSTGDYTLRRVGIEGGDTVTLTGGRAALAVSPDDLEKAKEGVRKVIRKLPVYEPDWTRIPKLKPIIERVVADDAGRPWILVVGNDSTQTWDIFSTAGTHLAVASSTIRFMNFQPVRILGDRIYGVSHDANDVPVIVVAQVRRKDAGN